MSEAPAPSQGPLRQADGSVAWSVWAPFSERVALVTWPGGQRTEAPMQAVGFGYHCHRSDPQPEGLRYAYRLDDGREYPDPASRWQPEGVHRPSALVFTEDFAWSDAGWRGIPREDLVIYELHVGTFTEQGTLDEVIGRLPELGELGVTAIEIMPLAQFPGERNWGYDGVHPFAVQNSYGGPWALQRLVDAAHAQRLGVILDVVYNHLGPEGNYLGKFGPYFTDRYGTPWGQAINFDGPDSDPVRQFVLDNARMWVRDFHMDGLRLDAVQAIHDFGPRHLLAELKAAVQEEAHAQQRLVHVIAESNQNDVRLIDPPERGGMGLDGVWSDDFHHSVRALLSGERDGYYQDYGRPEHLAKAFQDVFVYDGVYSSFRRRRHGTRVEDRDRTRFVVCIHNHDQVGNRAQGDRSATNLPPEAQRLACGLLMLSPCIPLLFMGEEYAERRPFPFFCSFGDPGLIEAVRRGRREEFAALRFEWGSQVPDPQDPVTFESAKLTRQWPEGSHHARMRRLYTDLLAARRTWPPLRDRRHTAARLAQPAAAGQKGDRSNLPRPLAATRASGPTAPVGCCAQIGPVPFLLVIERGAQSSLLALANLSPGPRPLPAIEVGQRQAIFSTEEHRYGGCRSLAHSIGELLPFELVIWGRSEWHS